MKRLPILILVLTIALVISLSAVAVLASGVYGTQSDPLVTVSYLTDVFTPTLRNELESQANAITEQFEGQLSAQLAAASGGFTVLTLHPGQTLQAQPGCELLLRSGTLSSGVALVDCTTGAAIAVNAPLPENHLCLADAAGTLTAATSVTVLARGVYTVQ